MSKVQTRRTVSFNRTVYEAIKVEADRLGMPAAHFLETLVRKAIRGLPKTEHHSLSRAKRTEKARRDAKATVITDLIARAIEKRPVLVPKREPLKASMTGADPIDQAIADAGTVSAEGLTIVEREHRKRKRSRKLVKILRERGLLTPENEGYASPDSWSAK